MLLPDLMDLSLETSDGDARGEFSALRKKRETERERKGERERESAREIEREQEREQERERERECAREIERERERECKTERERVREIEKERGRGRVQRQRDREAGRQTGEWVNEGCSISPLYQCRPHLQPRRKEGLHIKRLRSCHGGALASVYWCSVTDKPSVDYLKVSGAVFKQGYDQSLVSLSVPLVFVVVVLMCPLSHPLSPP